MGSVTRLQKPRVTVLTSVYNGERYLRQSIESILHQTFGDFEFVIVNDGSTDSSRDIILSYEDPRIRLIENSENLGLAKSLNRGLSVARGHYVARHDADDISHSTRLKKQIEYLDSHPEIAVLGTQARFIDKTGRVLRFPLWTRPVAELGIRWMCMFDSPFVHSSVMMQTEVIREKYGGYNGCFKRCQDYELWTRVTYNHRCHNLNERLVDFRIHSNSTSWAYPQNMQSLSAAMQFAASIGLGQRMSDEWVDLWIRINYPGPNFTKPVVDKLVAIIDTMQERFVSYNHVAKEQEQDICHAKNRMLLRIAYNCVVFDRSASMRLFLRVCHQDGKLARQVFPKFMAAFLFGRLAAKIYHRIRPL